LLENLFLDVFLPIHYFCTSTKLASKIHTVKTSTGESEREERIIPKIFMTIWQAEI